MVSRISGRLLTGPGAFFVAGVIDAGLLLVAYVRWRTRVPGVTRRS